MNVSISVAVFNIFSVKLYDNIVIFFYKIIIKKLSRLYDTSSNLYNLGRYLKYELHIMKKNDSASLYYSNICQSW